MHKHQQFNFFSNFIKYVRPTYGNKEELAPLNVNRNALEWKKAGSLL